MKTTFLPVLILIAGVLFSGCTDKLFSASDAPTPEVSPSSEMVAAPTSAAHPKLRFPNLMDSARSGGTASKDGNGNVNLYLAFSEYEANGVTRRVLDSYGITRRIMQEYGITRRVLDSYGVTRRVLEEYGVTRRILDEYGVTRRVLEQYGVTRRILQDYAVTITDAFLAEYGLTMETLEAQGVTRRVLDSYGVTRRVLDEYNTTLEQYETALATFDSVIRVRLRVSKTRPGISITFDDVYLDAILEELQFDPDIDVIDPDAEMTNGLFDVRRGIQKTEEMIPWSLQRIGGLFTQFDASGPVHVYSLDSGVQDFDLELAEQKDFTMLFENRDQETMDEEAIVHMDVFDPGEQGNWRDGSGHGSHVAGIIGSKKNDKGIRGVARGVKYHSLKVLTAAGRTDLTTVMAAVDYVTDQKQRNPLQPTVMNLSLGMDLGSGAYNALDDAVKRATEFGVVVVVSAGNDGRDASTYSPAHVREAITVAAYGQDDRFAGYSNYGPAVDLVAPGTDIVSLSHLPAESQAGDNVLMSGTSHAAPHVTGAAALYLNLHPTASPAEVKQALINFGQTTVLDAPMGTTNRSVYVGEFASDGLEQPFAVTKAEWKDGSRLVFEGTGLRLGTVEVIGLADGAFVGTFDVDDQGDWAGDIIPTAAFSCELEARLGAEAVAVSVVNAPETCAKPLIIEKAYVKKDLLYTKGTGPAGQILSVRNHDTGTEIVSAIVDPDGGWKFEDVAVDPMPCTLRATVGDLSLTMPVDGNRDCSSGSGVASNLIIDKASYGTDESGTPGYKVKGTTGPMATLAAYNAVSGVELGRFDADDKGVFDAEWDNPISVPCEIRTVDLGSGAESTNAVENAPVDCVGGFRLAEASWKSDMSSLHILVLGTPYAPVVLKNGRNGASFHLGQIDITGRFDKTIRNLPVIPCSVTAESDADSSTRSVTDAPSNCDVALTMNTAQFSLTQMILSLGGTGTPGMAVTLHNDAGTPFYEDTVGSTGIWRIDLDIKRSGAPPCAVSVHGANGDVLSATLVTDVDECNPNFEYLAPNETREQNPYSFVEITKAEWRNGALIVEGDGYVFMPVEIRSKADDAVLATMYSDIDAEFEASITGLNPVPCTITATLDGRTADRAVANAPLNCDGRDYLSVTKAEYDSGKQKLTLQGVGLGASGTLPVTFYYASSPTEVVATVTPDSDGSFRTAITGIAPGASPCAMKATIGGTTIDVVMGKKSTECR